MNDDSGGDYQPPRNGGLDRLAKAALAGAIDMEDSDAEIASQPNVASGRGTANYMPGTGSETSHNTGDEMEDY